MGEGMRPTRQQQCQRDKSQAETNKPVTGVAKGAFGSGQDSRWLHIRHAMFMGLPSATMRSEASMVIQPSELHLIKRVCE